MNFRVILSVACVSAAVLAGCKSNAPSAEPKAIQSWPATVPTAAAQLEALTFMSGSWYSVNPNGSVNREHWSVPRGKVMNGTFQQMNRAGVAAITEVSLIEVVDGVVTFRLRHMHRGLDVDHDRPKTEIYTLADSGSNFVVFKPSSDPAVPREKGVASIGYKLDDQGRLVQEIKYENGSPENNYTGISMREPDSK
jgi:hypothetical protein